MTQPQPPAPAPNPKETSSDRGADVLKTAIEIMAQGARGWSDALKQASEKVRANGSH